jgi:conjugative relaxase-like TrwC/TraI family protein
MVKNAESENRTAAHIFTLTAPKSVSIALSQADDELRKKILKAHEKATDKFLYAVSMYSRYSEQKGDEHIHAPIRAVKFGHIASDGAPNIRTDCVVFGIVETPESINDHFHALDVSAVLRQANLAASIYNSQLAWEMRKLGFGIEKNKENTSFEISGMNHPTDGLDKNIQDYSQEENNRLDETIRSVIQDVARKSSVYSGNQIEIGVLAETYGDFEPDKVLHDVDVFARKNLVHAYEKYDLNCAQAWYISKDTSAERIRAFRKKHNLEFDDKIHNHEQIELDQKGEIQTEKGIDQFKKPTHEERNINNQTPSSSSNFDNGFNAKTQDNPLTQTSKAPTQSKPNAEVTNILRNVANVYVAPNKYDEKNQFSPTIARKDFESSSQFELKISQAKPIETQSVLMSYANNNSIKEAAMVDAVNAGFIHVDDKRNISFIGKNDEGKIASIQKQNQNEERLPSKSSIVGGFTISTDAGMRDKYPPILPGLDNKIAIVQTGEEALALRSMQHQHNLEKTTIIVAKNSDALSSPHIKAKLQSADQIMRFDKVDLDLKALNQNSQEKNLNTDQSLAPRQ